MASWPRKLNKGILQRRMASDSPIQYSVVVPFFNEQENIPPLYMKLTEVMDGLGEPYELVFVDDGSKDESFKVLSEIYEHDRRVNLVRLRRNFGQTPALKAGFQGGRLPEIPPQPHQIHAPVVLVNFRKHLERFVLAAVIHKHQFVRLAEPVHHFGELHVEGWDIFLFIEERNDNGILNWRIACHSSLQYPFIKLPGPRSHSLSGESPAMRQDF